MFYPSGFRIPAAMAIESLKSDLKKIVLGSTELISRAGSLEVPSWRFPEKLATSLDIDRVLIKGGEKDEEAGRHLVLELIVDRLLLLLQCCVHGLQGTAGHESSTVPFTLGSTVKKLSRCMVQNSSRLSDLKKLLSSKNEKISSLESSLSELQKEHKLLQNRFKTYLGDAMDIDAKSELSKDSEAPDSLLLTSQDICTQTMDTAFALCAQCSATQLTLVDAASLVAEVCKEHKIRSKFSSCDWNALAKVGGIELLKWMRVLRTDLESLGRNRCLLKEVISERDHLMESECMLQGEIQKLQTRIEILEGTIREKKRSSEIALAKSSERLLAVKSSSEFRNAHIKGELKSSQEDAASLKTVISELKTSRIKVEEELHLVQNRELELKEANKKLEEQFESLVIQSQEMLDEKQIELNKSKLYGQTLEKKLKTIKEKQSALLSQLDEFNEECVAVRDELTQMEASRDKLIGELQDVQSKYTLLQESLSNEQDKLSESNQEHVVLSSQLSTLQAQLEDTKEQLNTERRNCRLLMDYPFVDQTGLDYRDHMTTLIQMRQQISANTIRILLLEEQNNELRHRTISEAKDVSKLTEPSQPLHLWENKLVSKLDSIRIAAQKRINSVQYLSQPMGSQEYEPQPPHQFIKVSSSKGVEVGDGNSKLKGRLKHLISAIAEAHSASSSSKQQPSQDTTKHLHGRGEEMSASHSNAKDDNDESMNALPVVHLCANCDEMCYDKDEKLEHSSSRDKLS